MQEEVENRTVNLVISTGKLTTRAIMAGIRKYSRHEKLPSTGSLTANRRSSSFWLRTRAQQPMNTTKAESGILSDWRKNMGWTLP